MTPLDPPLTVGRLSFETVEQLHQHAQLLYECLRHDRVLTTADDLRRRAATLVLEADRLDRLDFYVSERARMPPGFIQNVNRK